MAHEIMSNLFYGSRNRPAWHGISIFDETDLDPDQDYTATEVLEVFGNPQYWKQPLFYDLNGESVESSHSQILRGPLGDDKSTVPLGVVSSDWELITPQIAAQDVWDNGVGVTPETMAFLREGRTLFITGKLPSVNVSGDEVDNYLILHNPLDGGRTAQGLVSPVRVVCQNTLNYAQIKARTSFRIAHRPGATKLLSRWLKNTYQTALMTVDVMREAGEIMAKTSMSKIELRSVTDRLYRYPSQPEQNVPRVTPYKKAIRQYEARCDWLDRAKSKIEELYDGLGVGMDTPAAAGTAWGAYNAIAEFENYRRGRRENMAVNIVDGDRSAKIAEAHSLILETCKIPVRAS